MTGEPNKTRSNFKELQFKAGGANRNSSVQLRLLLMNSHTIAPLISGVVQVFLGLTLICITILGLLSPLWISLILSILGSVLFMMGGFLIYHTVTRQGSFDTLINQAIRRAIQSQN